MVSLHGKLRKLPDGSEIGGGFVLASPEGPAIKKCSGFGVCAFSFVLFTFSFLFVSLHVITTVALQAVQAVFVCGFLCNCK